MNSIEINHRSQPDGLTASGARSSGKPDAAILGSLRKVARKALRVARAIGPLARRSFARLYFSFPVARRHNPRRKMVTFQEQCLLLKSFPSDDSDHVNDWYLTFSPPQAVRREPSISLDPAENARLMKGTLKYQFGYEFEIPEIFLACVRNAKLFGQERIVLSNENHIFVESALSSQEILESSGIFTAIRTPTFRNLSGSYCLLASPWSDHAYYHWLIEALPRLAVIEHFDSLKDLPLIVPPKFQRFHMETLAAAGVADSRLVRAPDANLQVDTLYYPEVFSAFGSPSPQAVAWLRSRFLKNAPSSQPADRKLYISRRDARRNILNEDEIAGYLKARGFEIICPAEHSFLEQVEMFSRASIVVGPHGAGFTNMVFAPPGATLVEFFGDNYINACFWALANVCRQRHAVLMAQSSTLDYSVPLHRLDLLLSKLGV